MKSLMSKGLLAITLSLIALSANANWQCKIHNANGKFWYGVGPTRKAAAATAMGFCAGRGQTSFAANCTLDYCRQGNYGPGTVTPVPVQWQCNIANNRGQAWFGLGPTRKAAAMTAMGFCAGKSSSAFARSCHITTCFIKR